MEALIEAAARLGWPSAVSLVMVIAFAVAWRRWRREDKIEEELKNAEQNYQQAVDSGDPDRIRIAARRLSDARKRAGS